MDVRFRPGIQWHVDAIYARKICAAVADLTVNFIIIWLFGYVSESIVLKSERH